VENPVNRQLRSNIHGIFVVVDTKMKISKPTIVALAAALAVGGLFAVNSNAANARKTERPAQGRLLQRAKEKLGITDEQAAQIKAVLKGEKETLTGLTARMHEARMELRGAIRATDANETSVRAASAKVAVVEADLAVERLRLFSKISPILTDEQRAKLNDMESQMDDFVDRAVNRAGQRLSE
jgi:Spy/CpxP family protein refolding chaperone